MIIVVGGHSRKIGKTSVVAALISSFVEARWTALKITSHHHDAAGSEPFVLTEETEATPTDSGRYLAAGAQRSLLLRASPQQLEAALSRVKPIFETEPNVIIESNRVMDLLQPDLYLLVVDPSNDDWKSSARRNLSQADAILLVKTRSASLRTPALPRDVPWFPLEPPGYSSPEFREFLARRMAAGSAGN